MILFKCQFLNFNKKTNLIGYKLTSLVDFRKHKAPDIPRVKKQRIYFFKPYSSAFFT